MSRYFKDNPEPQENGSGRRTDPFYFLMLILIIAVTALTVSIVVFFIASRRFASSGQPEAAASSFASSEERAPSSGGASAMPESSPSGGDASTASEGAGTASVTASQAVDETKATAAFEKNSIDKAKEDALLQAGNSAAILSAYDKALGSWKTTLEDMRVRLVRYGADIAAEQNDWLRKTNALIAAKEKELSEEGGSAQQLQLAEYWYQLYRDRALTLFLRIYAYDPTYLF